MKAETSTCDVWVDSSITPLIISGWPDDEKRFKRLYPNTLRPQGVEIVRTWAFYTIYRSWVALTGVPPWEEILLNGNVLAPDGKKMSKSLGNIISPTELLRDYPVDAIRQWGAMSGAMAKDRPFSYEDIRYSKSFLSKVWNAAKFAEMLGKAEEPGELTMIDRWVLGRLNSTIKEVTDAMERYEYHHAIGRLQSFFWSEFCDYYLEYIKHRVYNDEPSKQAAIQIRHRAVSKRHALIEQTPQGYRISDLESRNGVRLNSHRVRKAHLRSGDEIELGELRLTFFIRRDKFEPTRPPPQPPPWLSLFGDGQCR